MSEEAEVVEVAEDELGLTGADESVQAGELDVEDSGEDVDFSWSDDADQEDTGEEVADEQESSEEYSFDLGEQTHIPSVIHGELGELAQELGLPGDKAAQLLNRGLEVYQQAHAEMNRELGRELRKEWGRDFDAKLKATKAFAARVGRAAGLKAADVEPMMGPYGVRILNACREMVSEGGRFAGRAGQAVELTTQQRLDAFYADGEKMAAVLDSSHPRHEAVNAELNALYGI